jgi:hypothetical protein
LRICVETTALAADPFAARKKIEKSWEPFPRAIRIEEWGYLPTAQGSSTVRRGERLMPGKKLAIWLLLFGVIAVSGCNKERSLIGKWQASSSTYYFREDGILFYKAPSGTKYRGQFHVSKSTDAMIVQSRMHGLYGATGTLNVKFQVQFLTADRMRIDVLNDARENRVIMLSRADEMADAG